jgi:hypothetical protein
MLNGETALHAAFKFKQKDNAICLIALGWSTHILNNDNLNAIDVARKSGNCKLFSNY